MAVNWGFEAGSNIGLWQIAGVKLCAHADSKHNCYHADKKTKQAVELDCHTSSVLMTAKNTQLKNGAQSS